MTGYKSKRAAAQAKLVVTDIDGHIVRDVRKPKKAAQPAQEPIGYAVPTFDFDNSVIKKVHYSGTVPLYTLPPQRPWVGLTDEEMESIFLQCRGEWNGDYWKIEDANFHPFLRTIEAKLKEKNT
jgi:hypothetical protein